jgi:hypothetical protein
MEWERQADVGGRVGYRLVQFFKTDVEGLAIPTLGLPVRSAPLRLELLGNRLV